MLASVNDRLVHLGVLAAKTAQGRRAVAVSLVGGVEAHHVVDAGFVAGSRSVEEWLLGAGINPDEAYTAMPVDYVVGAVLLPAIGDRTLVVPHADMDVNLVDHIVSEAGRLGNPVIVSGIDLTGPLPGSFEGLAGRRAEALRTRYEDALARARISPVAHALGGAMDADVLHRISVDGPFAKGEWTLEEPEDALYVMLSLAGLSGMAEFVVEDGPAAGALERLADDAGLSSRLAA
jgi:hypothetical protein